MDQTFSEPVPEGTRVRYYGSLEERHGEYVVAAVHPASGSYATAYVDGVKYVLLPEGMRFGDRDKSLVDVRRTSFEILEA